MPAALQTSKRKFHDLLERITSTSSAQAPAAKRARLAPVDNGIPPATSRPLAVPRSRISSAAKPTAPLSATPSQRAHTSPWSHDAFLARLSTYSEVRHWTSKPDAVNEVAWARGGWVCDVTAVNRVACRGGCEQGLLVQLRPSLKDDKGKEIEDTEDYAVDIDDALVAKYAELISDGHSEDCLWRDHGCSEDVYRMPLARPSVWVPELRTRYMSFADVINSDGKARLPDSNTLVHPFDLETIKPLLPTTLIEADEQSAESLDDGALAFALLGWHYTSQDGMPLATCDHCFRRLGLWLYTSNDEPGGTAETEDQDRSMKLDLVENHRDYCPWVSGASQNQPGSLAGLSAWEVLQRCIENHAAFEASGKQLQRGAAEQDRAQPASEKSAEEIEQEDKRRAQKLMDFTRSIGKRMWLSRKK